VTIHSGGQIISSLSYIEGITLSANEEIHGVAGIANGKGLGVLVQVDNWDGEGHAAGVLGTGFAVDYLTGISQSG
jgi:hypothetical protein